MKNHIFILIHLLSIGCFGQIGNINAVINKSALVDLPIDYNKLSVMKGDSLQETFKKDLLNSQYFLIIKNKKILNKPISFQNISLVGRINLSSKYDVAIFREVINLNDAIYYLFSFNKNGKLLSALTVIEKGYMPNVTSIINQEKIICIKKEYEDHIENYNFMLQDDGIFKRTGYSEEKL